MKRTIEMEAEWLEADGLGGFAMGTAGGIRTRRYHGLLLTAADPPTGRMMLVNGFDAWIETPDGVFALTTQRYSPGALAPDMGCSLDSFTVDPWPTWVFRLRDGTLIQHEIFVRHGAPLAAVAWRLLAEGSRPTDRSGRGPTAGRKKQNDPRNHAAISLCVRPFLSGRDYHALHHENPTLNFEPQTSLGCLIWQTYAGVPQIVSCSNAQYRHEPFWYRRFQYEQERARGLDDLEDLAAPGVLKFDLSEGEAAWILAAGPQGLDAIPNPADARGSLATLRTAELARRAAFPSPLHRAADAYLVRRGQGKSVIAGYPWFTDWGRDTFIALRGLALATGRFDDARAILLEWSGAVSEGMLPNRFPDRGEAAEYNAVDASLWYIIAVHEFLSAADAGKANVTRAERRRLEGAVEAILSGYAAGTRYDIHCDTDGLLAAGRPGVQLTWMDAKVGDRVITPRIGKPVEVQALWLNSLWSAQRLSHRWEELFVRGRDSFRARFWCDVRGCLYDVVDCDHRPNTVDLRFRPNQILAVGGLPIALIENGPARKIVDAVEQRLWTPLGLRSLSPEDPEYAPHYHGGVCERDSAYHQGTVWPWLIGPFVDAWVRVRGSTPEARQEARRRFLAPLEEHCMLEGLGHVSEVADGAAPHRPGGCPFQAWSVGELLRLESAILFDEPGAGKRRALDRTAKKNTAAHRAAGPHA